MFISGFLIVSIFMISGAIINDSNDEVRYFLNKENQIEFISMVI